MRGFKQNFASPRNVAPVSNECIIFLRNRDARLYNSLASVIARKLLGLYFLVCFGHVLEPALKNLSCMWLSSLCWSRLLSCRSSVSFDIRGHRSRHLGQFLPGVSFPAERVLSECSCRLPNRCWSFLQVLCHSAVSGAAFSAVLRRFSSLPRSFGLIFSVTQQQ